MSELTLTDPNISDPNAGTTKEYNNERAFADELKYILRKYSIGKRSDTPDFILANYLMGCLLVFEGAVKEREMCSD